MSSQKAGSGLASLENSQLSAITFVQDYLQLHFDGPHINAYVWPRISTRNDVVGPGMPGYRDVLCEQIGKVVARAVEEPNEALSLYFEDDTLLQISLKDEDRTSVEAANFRDDNGELWVW